MTGTKAAARDAVELARSAAGRRVVLGLAGPPGAGKSTLASAMVNYACDQMGNAWAAYLPLDGFHLSEAQLERLGLERRKGAPDTFDTAGYVALLSRVADDSGTDIYVPEYDRTVHDPIAARLVIGGPARLVVTEGNYLAVDAAEWRAARQFMDQLWYVDAPDILREERLVSRQVSGGRAEQAARAWFESNDVPNGELVKASRANTDRTVTPVR